MITTPQVGASAYAGHGQIFGFSHYSMSLTMTKGMGTDRLVLAALMWENWVVSNDFYCEGIHGHLLADCPGGGLSYWYMLDSELPASAGAHTFETTNSAGGPRYCQMIVSEFYRVNQKTPFGSVAYNTNRSLDVPCAINTIVADAFTISEDAAPSVDGGQTLLSSGHTGFYANGMGASRKLAVATPTNMNWTSGTAVHHIAIPIGGRPQVFGPRGQNN